MIQRSNGARTHSRTPVLRNTSEDTPILITGGAGFIGVNLADRLLARGNGVLIFDNLSRAGVRDNLRWLCARYPRRVQVQIDDVRDFGAVASAVERSSAVFHLAAQVAVTSSVSRPVEDFEVNARGTLNVLEAIRLRLDPPPLLFASTNKVYGTLDNVAVREASEHYEPADPALATRGVSEDRPLDFHSPYGCSKGAAEQYVLDYARTFGLHAVVFRMSCIYGPHQCGTEDQGWVAHFLMRVLQDQPITIYGDGLQVRDLLFIDDLLDAMDRALPRIGELTGRAFNVGGGPTNAMSLLQVLRLIERVHGKAAVVEFGDWRPGDQRYYASDTGRFQSLTGWSPRVRAEEGIRRLYDWLRAGRADDVEVLAAVRER